MYVGDTQRALTGPREALRIRQVALLDEGEDLAGTIIDLLHRYATRGESAALLALAAIVSDHDDAKDAIALLGTVLCDVVALDPAESLEPKKLAEIREHIPPRAPARRRGRSPGRDPLAGRQCRRATAGRKRRRRAGRPVSPERSRGANLAATQCRHEARCTCSVGRVARRRC